MNDIVGKYKGIKVYKVTFPEYVNSRLYKNKDNIYLIDGELIYNNEAFASYNGNYVSDYDPHKKRTFYTVPTFTVNKEEYDTANGKLESKISSTSGNETEILNTEDILGAVFNGDALAAIYDTDYFSGMTDVDAFLKANLEF